MPTTAARFFTVVPAVSMPNPIVDTSPMSSATLPKVQFHAQSRAERRSRRTDIFVFVFQGPFGRADLSPGPDGVEGVIWSRSTQGLDSRTFELPCSGDQLINRDGSHDTKPPFTCGTYPRRSIIKYFLRNAFGGTKDSNAAKSQVIAAVKKLINETREAWSNDANYYCKCKNGTAGWECCAEQTDCATEPCKCPEGFEVKYSVACCASVCGGLAGAGLMKPYSLIKGEALAQALLQELQVYMTNMIWTKTDPWLMYDPLGYETYRDSWLAAGFKLSEMGMFDTTKNVVYYDETTHPLNSTFWDHCAGLLGQVMWTMPIDRGTGRAKFNAPEFDPIDGRSDTAGMSYQEDFIQKLTLEAYKQSPTYWHYNVRYAPSDSAMCQRATSAMPGTGSFPLSGAATYGVKQFGFSSMTLGGAAGTDCHCGWWNTATSCKIPETMCSRMVQLLGFNRICLDQNRTYNATDHFLVLDAIDSLLAKDPSAQYYSCPSMQVSDHWGFNATANGQLFANATSAVLNDGVAGFRIGNTDWLYASQAQFVNPTVRAKRFERSARAKASLNCNPVTTLIADNFVDELFPAAQGVRQSAPQSYCTRYGIELARLTIYKASYLTSYVGTQQATVDKWKLRCQYKLRQVAMCKKHRVLNAAGPPTSTSNCPFTLTVSPTFANSYAVTPGCLLILWDPVTGVSSIYDPCLCNDCSMDANKRNIQVPMSSLCKVDDSFTLVADDVIVGENDKTVDIPLGRGSFADLLSKSDRLKINTPVSDTAHWAVKTSILHADLLLDWWPDEWKQPVGYHVTPSCSLNGDQRWKTFDSAWRWDSTYEKMIYTPEVADPVLSRNAFGASGFCRTHNYGMPMTNLNTMRTCTRENINAQADPLVPAPATERVWVDGQEYCSTSPFQTPWNYTTTGNTPNQWSVGTLQQGPLSPYYASEWGAGCGPYPIRSCIVDDDCAVPLKCVKGQGVTGVCGLLAAGNNNFECATHAQCSGDKMCSGDGLCVEGVWHVVNKLSESVSFRTHSQTCASGTPLDTWGTSTMETVPDILNASGLCSYRSWVENRRMSQLNQCVNSNTCPNFQGVYPWNFSSPRMLGQGDAFSDNVLKVLPHACDRDYQHYEGFRSCTPSDNYMWLRNTATGLQLPKPASGWRRGNRTQTYRVSSNRQLPLMHHVENAAGPTVGFVGIDGKTYSDLGIGTKSSTIMSCNSMQVCGFQHQFRVNNIVISSSSRLVLDNGVSRGYTMNDLISCGVYGYFMTSAQVCKIDFAVAPLAHLYLNANKLEWAGKPAFQKVVTLTTDTYTMASRVTRLDALSALPDAVIAYIGGVPTTLQEYVDRSQKFVDLYAQIKAISMPVYPDAGPPAQLYYLTLYGAYEVPYAWWYKCVWLAGFAMSTDPVTSESGCVWHPPDMAQVNVGAKFAPFDARLAALLGLNVPAATDTKATKSLRDLLIQLPGRITQTLLDKALVDYVAERNRWVERLVAQTNNSVTYICYQRKEYIQAHSQLSQRYQLQRLKQYTTVGDFDLSPAYLDDRTNATLCNGDSCFQSVEPVIPLTSNDNFMNLMLAALTTGSPVTSRAGSIPLLTTTVPDEDKMTLSTLFAMASAPQTTWDAISLQFKNNADGCKTPITRISSKDDFCLCTSWGDCASLVQAKLLSNAGLSGESPRPSVAPTITLAGGSGANSIPSFDACQGETGLTCGDQCIINNTAKMQLVTSITLPVGVQAETYDELEWDCTLITCADTTASIHNTYVPYPYSPGIMNDEEVVEVTDYNFSQYIRGAATNPWTGVTEAYERSQLSREGSDRQCYDADVWMKKWGHAWTLKLASYGDNGMLGFEERHVPKKGEVQMNIRKLKYYVNGTLSAEVEMYPCGYGSEFMGMWNELAAANGYRKLTSIEGWGCELVGKGQRPKWTGYMPKYVRTYSPLPGDSTQVNNAEIQRVLDRIRYIISSLESKLPAAEYCLRNEGSCDIRVNTTEFGKMSSHLWTSAENQAQCAGVRDDTIFGCSMWPGEDTYGWYKCLYDFSGQHYYGSGSNSDTADNRWACDKWHVLDAVSAWCPESSRRNMYHPWIGRCLMDDATDSCKNGESGTANYGDQVQVGSYRNSQVSGRTTTYTYYSQRQACADNGPATCALKEESRKLTTPLAACPGRPGDSAADSRRAAYVRSMGQRLKTSVTWLKTVSTSGTTNLMDAFYHVYLGLKPGFRCGSCTSSSGVCSTTSCTPTAPACSTNQLPVEMLRNLFTCVDCPMVSATYRTGQHNCRLRSPVLNVDRLNYMPGWSNISAASRDYLTGAMDSAPIDVVLEGFRWLSSQIMALGMPSVSISYDVPSFMGSYNTDEPYTYNPIDVVTYSKGMETAATRCASTGLMPDFTNCSYDGRRRNLRSFIRANYKVSDGMIIDPGVTLLWKMLRSQMLAQNIPAWESYTNKSGMFLNDLFDDKWCAKGNMADNLCYKRKVGTDLVVDVLNPGLLGIFEPRAGCDTEVRNQMRVVSSACSNCNSSTFDMNSIEGGGMMACLDGDAVSGISESLDAPSNLCGKSPPSVSQCTNRQGTLGQVQSASDGSTLSNLYSRVPWTAANSMPSGLNSNVLFQGKTPVSGFVSNMALNSYDIGGHFIRMVLDFNKDGDPVLKVVGMPLISYGQNNDALGDVAYGLGQSTSSDLRWLQRSQMASEVDALRTLYPDPVCQTWDCPLRRRAFYHGKDEKFRPKVPDPPRTQILYGSRSHPTQVAYSLKMNFRLGGAPILGLYQTSNGFCACASATCPGCQTDTDALMGSWRQSSVLSAGASTCKQQLDWPYAGGTLRDGSSYNERFAAPSCGILDRLPTFKYRYWNSGIPTPATKTTLDKGGACHMGWPFINAGPLANCYLLPDSDMFVCKGVAAGYTKARLRARTVPELVAQSVSRRMRLVDCSPPPTYQMGSTPATATAVPSETSYGQLKRVEASRLLASDLRKKLCGSSATCDATKDWTLLTFWQNVFTKGFPSLPSENGANLSLWNTSWAACLQGENGTQTCDGKVSREDWLSPNRGAKCVEALTTSSLANSLTRDVDVCNMDTTLDRFCRTIQDARYGVYEANCLYSGVCRQKLFFYQPSTYAINNGEFVRSTVQTFYNNTVAGSCIPDFDTAAAIEAGKHNLDNCAAVKLNILVTCIQVVRVMMDSMIELMFYMSKLMMLLFQLMSPLTAAGQQQAIATQLGALLKIIMNKFLALLKEFGNLVYKVIMNGPLGKYLEGAIKWMCQFLSWLFSTIIHVILCWARTYLLIMLRYVAMPVVDVLNAIALNQLNFLKDGINVAIDLVEKNVPCDDRTLFECSIGEDETDTTTGLLPNPTRCWAGVEPGIGSLGCAASDTCMTDNYGLVACGACQGAAYMTKYGCNTLTKLCSCNVFPVGITSCNSHEECTMESDSIDCQYVDSYLQPSYGNVPCRQCSNPICLVSDGSGVGQCSCLLRPVSNQRCTSVGERVSPNAAELCLVASSSGSSSIGSSNSYTADFRTLASAPCTILNQGQTYCMKVYTSASVSMPLVVGLAVLQGRRRMLLSVGSDQPLLSNVSVWEGEGEPCRSLVLANVSSLGILERYTLGECWRWRDVGVQILADENMTDVSPFFLVSWRDLLSALLQPESMIKVLAKAPVIVNKLLLHAEMAQPVYIAMLYYSALIPDDLWRNGTFMEHVRTFFMSRTSQSSNDYVIMGLPSRLVLVPGNATKNTTVDNITIMTPPPSPLNTTLAPRRRHRRYLMGIDAQPSVDTVYLWSQGPYPWPPNYQYWSSATGKPTCAVVNTAIDVFKNGLNITMMYYTTPHEPPAQGSLPKLPVVSIANWSLPSVPNNMLDSVEWMWALSSVFVNETDVVSYLDTSTYMTNVKNLVKCDFIKVQTCAGRVDLFWTALNVFIACVIATILGRVLGIPYVEIVVIFLYVPMVFYFAYGYNTFTCPPLVPTCLLADATAVLQYFLPEQIQWPDDLVTSPNCSQVSCLRSCTSDPNVGFTSIADHVAWLLCEIDNDYCVQLGTTTSWQALKTPLIRKGSLYPISASMRASQRICFAVTMVNSIPLLLVLSIVTSFLPAVVGILASLWQFACSMVVAVLLFVHSSVVAD